MRQKGPDPTPTPGPGSNAMCSSTLVLAHMDVCTAAHDLGLAEEQAVGRGQRAFPGLAPSHLGAFPGDPFGAELREHSATDCPRAAPAHCGLCSSSSSSAWLHSQTVNAVMGLPMGLSQLRPA